MEQMIEAVDSKPRWPCNFGEDDDTADMHDDYVDYRGDGRNRRDDTTAL